MVDDEPLVEQTTASADSMRRMGKGKTEDREVGEELDQAEWLNHGESERVPVGTWRFTLGYPTGTFRVKC